MSRRVTVYVSRDTDDGEAEVVVECHVYPGDPGRLHGPPEDCYPPEPPDVDILSAALDGVPVELTRREEQRVVERAIELAAEDDECPW